MSTTIDSRVVEMRFDNKQFESNVQTSIGTIDKLQQKLNLTGAAKGLENVSSAARSVDMSPLSSAVETVGLKFSAMYSIADQALRNITNSVMNTGKRMLSALTIDPIKTGFSEYETKINAVQTIMSNTASKGKTMEDVTKVLGELNTYADKTIYNFAEMTRNIGTFTAAGVGLEESAIAIQGIANLAAMSGSNSQQASTAMYQLSQAMASGTVKLMDWNSVVNAGMGGQLFQDALKETARTHGIAVDSLIEKNGSFRESLQEGWITTEILTETLSKMTKSGAAEYLSNLTGVEESQITAAQKLVESNKDGSASYEELATKLAATGKISKEKAIDILKMADNAEDAATKVKTFTQLWDTLKESAQSGWSQTWEILVGDFEEAKETLTEFSNLIGEVINESAEARNKLLQGWKDAGGRAMLVESLLNIFESVMSVVKPIKDAFREIFPPTTVDQLMGITEAIKSFTEKLTLTDTASENLKRTFKGVFAILDIIKQAFGAAFKAISPLFGGIDNLGGGILGFTAKIGDALVKFDKFIETSGVFTNTASFIASAIEYIQTAFSKLISVIKDGFVIPGIEGIRTLLERVGSRMTDVNRAAGVMKDGVVGAMDAIASAFTRSDFFAMLESLWKGLKTIGTGIMKAFSAIAGVIFETIGAADFKGFLDILNSIIAGGVGVGLVKFLKSVTEPFEGLSELLEGVTGILDGVRGCFEAYQTQLKAGALMKIASAIAILVASIVVLSFIDSDRLFNAIGAITMLFADLMGSMAVFGRISGNLKGVTTACTAMISISVAVLVLASALKTIGDLDFNELMTGFIGVAGLSALVVGIAKALGSGGKTVIKGATQMVIFAAAIKILASACEDLSYLGWEELTKGLIGVGVLLASISLFISHTDFNGKAFGTALGIVALSSALVILASVCTTFASMGWEEIGKGLAGIAGLLAELMLFVNLTGDAKHVISTGLALIAIGAAMKILASSMKDIASLSWGGLTKGLIGMAASLAAVTIALNFMPKNMIGLSIGLIGVSTALLMLTEALVKMGGMSWSEVAKGLVAFGGSMLIMAVGLNAMKGAMGGSAAMLVAAAALAILTPTLVKLGSLSLGTIGKSLLVLAGAFTVIGVAGYLLQPLIGTILALAGAFALIGLSVFTIGAGLTMAGAGLSAIAIGITALATSIAGGATAIVAGLTVVISGIIGLIPAIIEQIGHGIVALCRVISDGAPAIGEAVKAIVLSIVDVLVECVPAIADGALKLIVGVLAALVTYTPQLVEYIFQFLIGLLDGISAKLPNLIESAVGVIESFFIGIVQALSAADPDAILKGLVSVGLLTGIIYTLSAIGPFIPGAMAGVLGLGVVATELALVLAALGALAQISGLDWLISEGGYLLESIGTAIGQFVGGLIGGIAQGATSSLPNIGEDLSNFMTNLKPFIDGAAAIDSSALDGVKNLVGVIMALTGANLLDNLTSYITGSTSLEYFSEQLAAFGPGIKQYADSVSGIDATAVEASANAAKALAELANNLPNSGGLASWFAGENDIGSFGAQLVPFGEGLKRYSEAVAGMDTEAVANSAKAAQALVELTNYIPNEGGMVSWFTGENSVAKFGEDLALLGIGLQSFSIATAGINAEGMIAVAGAAKALAEMTTYIPNEGGIVAWLTGENSISRFSNDLTNLGLGLSSFAALTAGIIPENVTAAANAAKALAEMTSYIPNEGGMVSWFTGENSIAKFSGDMVTLGLGLKGFSDSITGINPENVTAAANAAKALAEMTSYIPNEGGMIAWFTGENSISNFSLDIMSLGSGLKGFSDAVSGIAADDIMAAANAAKALAELTTYIPNEGGIVAWFTGESSMATFASQLPKLGAGLKGFSDSIAGIAPENVSAAANAAKALAEMTAVIPTEGGIKAWFTGETSIAMFASKLPTLGAGLKGFSDSVAGINPENATAAASAAKSLGEMTAAIPKNTDKISDFGENIVDFGDSLSSYFSKTSGITDGSISASTKAVEAVKGLSTLNSGNIKAVANAVDDAVKSIKNMAKIPKDSTKEFMKALENLGKASADSLVEAFDDIESDMKKVGQKAIESFIKGIQDKTSSAEKACKTLAKDSASATSSISSSFTSAGRDLVIGFANGISENTYRATAKARAMARAAAQAAKEELDINSPSKVFKAIGSSIPEGFAMGIDKLSNLVTRSAVNMGDTAIDNVNSTIATIADIVNSDIDSEPTIRPILDLTNVRTGARAIGSMFGNGTSVGVLANVGSINAMMNQRSQNGNNNELISEIRKLRKDFVSTERNSYNINGITYDDGNNISEAVKSLVRAVKVERRT